MPDPSTEDNEFGKELAEAWDSDEKSVEAEVPETPAAPANNAEDTSKDEPNKSENGEEKVTPAADAAKKPQDGATPTEAPKTEEVETPTADSQPLTKQDVTEIIQKLRTDERDTTQNMDVATNEVIESFYPDGLSNVLIDQATGKALRTPQDVVDAAQAQGGDMSMEQATQWLMNEQYALDHKIADIRDQARGVAETTVNFKRDASAALQKYQPLFEAYPQLQEKAYKLMMRQTKIDEQHGVVLQAPDVMDLYDDYLEPYQKAYEFSTNQPATNPVNQQQTPPAPSRADRMDDTGDGGVSEVDDPNNFAQQVTKELAKGI